MNYKYQSSHPWQPSEFICDLVSFPIGVINYPDKSSLGEIGTLASGLKGNVHHVREVKAKGA